MRQIDPKFPKYVKVLVRSRRDSIFTDIHGKEFWGIVDGCYADLYGGRDIKSYALYILSSKEGKIISRGAWFDEADLVMTWTPQDRLANLELIEAYEKERRNRSEDR